MKILFIALFAIIIATTSCSKYKGFKESDSGLFYNFHTENEKEAKPNMGDILTVSLMYKTDKDSILFESNKNPNPLMISLREPEYKGDFYEALAMMHKGDSATFIIKADSFFLKTAKAPAEMMPKFITAETMLYFNVKLTDIKPKAVFEKEMQEQKAKFEEEMLKRKDAEADEIGKFVKENKITVKPSKTGLYFIEKTKGKGEKAAEGKTCVVNYTGKLLDGTVFDSSERRQPIDFILGKGGVIDGWHEGIAKMSKGGKAQLVIPSSLGYKDQGDGRIILPYTPLVFDVELIDIK